MVVSVDVGSVQVSVKNLQELIWVLRRWKTMKQENNFKLVNEKQKVDLFMQEETQRAVDGL